MLHIPVIFSDKSDEVYMELAAIAANNFVSVTKDSINQQIICTLSMERGCIPGVIKDLEQSRYSQLRILANRVIVESDSRYKSASPRRFTRESN